MIPSENIISDFIAQYTREIDFYLNSAKICAESCERELEQSGIRAIVTYRAKRIDKLKEKLTKRNLSKEYTCTKEIYDDIVDLAGVRIALYFPGDREEIEKFIKNNFLVEKIKDFPSDSNAFQSQKNSTYKKVFSGYRAQHYRVKLRPENLGIENQKYSQAMVEIQVASVLMHAWAEVEHDLIYKPLSGEISIDEYEILDELNGLIISGEIALQRLQKAVKNRVRTKSNLFSNHYELAAFLYDQAEFAIKGKSDDIVMGRSDILYKFLENINFSNTDFLKPYLKDLDPNTESLNIVQQVLDKILDNNPDLYEVYFKTKSEIGSHNPYGDLDDDAPTVLNPEYLKSFIREWSTYEISARKYLDIVDPEKANAPLMLPEYFYNITQNDDIINEVKAISSFKNILVHGNTLPSEKDIINAIEALKNLNAKIKTMILGENLLTD